MNSIASVDVISNATNCPIVKLSDRQFPGVVLQGDTLHSLYRHACRVLESLDCVKNERVYDDCEFLAESLKAILTVYEGVLTENGIALPYVKVS
jgi:hypothetical protein